MLEAIREAILECLEYQLDIQAIEAHEAAKARGEAKTCTLDEVENILGLNDV